ncbi:MBL fold metallo-hydrolase [Marinilactibacillus kalidii]|uniref:MBL fold metallo-hydrolase n=1 Tax=Marinilactibacillus kalidii TaxID=2820274 RepID=UPI001ABDDB9A|nr:MBL fold metallo-hydrolase [Marinilactibacillus kalidii]
MKIQLIRNATLRIDYAGKRFLIDPYLAEKGTYDPVKNTIRQEAKNPIVDLPVSIEEVTENIDAVVLTHLHLDHYDPVARDRLPKEMPIFVQNETDQKIIENDGFKNVRILQLHTDFDGISLSKTAGEHGRGEIKVLTGKVCGVVFKHSSEKTLYIAGDTVWYEGVQTALHTHTPDVIIVNAGANEFLQGGPIVMNEKDVHALHLATPASTIIAVHMEAVNHWILSRKNLREYARENDFSEKLLVPNDGETTQI